MRMSLGKRGIAALAFVFSLALCALPIVLPHTAMAQSADAVPSGGLVPCGQDGPLVGGKQACGFQQAMTLVGTVIHFLIFYIAPIIIIVVLLWGGFLILTAGGNVEQVNKAKGMFWNALIGLVIAMVAWLIIRFILVQLGVDESVFPVFY